jgi:hypothetical protein
VVAASGLRKSWCVSVPRQMGKATVDVGMDSSVALTTSEPNYDRVKAPEAGNGGWPVGYSVTTHAYLVHGDGIC